MKLNVFYKELVPTFRRELEGCGWKKDARKNIFRRPINQDTTAFLGLNRAHRGDAVEINPVVGVRFEPLEMLFAKLEDIGYTSSRPPTVSRSLGYLMPAKMYIPWVFESREDFDKIAELAAKVEQYGIPFAGSGCTLPKVVHLLEDPASGIRDRRLLRLATGYVMLGRAEDARRVLDAEVAQLRQKTDFVSEHFRRYRDKLLEGVRC